MIVKFEISQIHRNRGKILNIEVRDSTLAHHQHIQHHLFDYIKKMKITLKSNVLYMDQERKMKKTNGHMLKMAT